MKIVHKMPYTAIRNRDLRVVLIGSGGNGSTVLGGLPYLHHALQAWGFGGGLDVHVLDGDTVSPTNCVRQPFGRADIGLNKASVLVTRLNMFHGLSWSAVPSFFSKKQNPCFDSYHQIDLLISCVDTREARRELHEALFTAAGPWGNVRYWLDMGNSNSFGQFVLGQPANVTNKKLGSTRLRTVTELYPEIMDISRGEGNEPSCSAAEALDRQEPFLNQALASSAMAMVTRLIRYGEINYHGAFYNAGTGSLSPIGIDPENWQKMERRRRDQKRSRAARS